MSHTLAPPTGTVVCLLFHASSKDNPPFNRIFSNVPVFVHPHLNTISPSKSWQNEGHNNLLTLPEHWSPVASCFDCENPTSMDWGKCLSFSCDPQRQWGISIKQTAAHAKDIRHWTCPSLQFDACLHQGGIQCQMWGNNCLKVGKSEQLLFVIGNVRNDPVNTYF